MTENQRTILIIDDCPEDRETYRRYLLQDSRYTYTILEEEYGENGLELCRLVKPDAILLDFLLPDIDGLEFLEELKTQIGRTSLPVVMLTGQGNEAIAVQAMKSGAQDYLVKGNMTPQTLRLAIHNVVERAHLLWQLERSEERFRTSVENMLDSFGIYTSVRDNSDRIVDFSIEYVNAAACANNRMTQSEQIGKRLLELPPSNYETGLFDEYCQVVETGEPLFKEALVYADIYTKQNLTKAFDIRVAKLGDGFVAAWRDITERKQAEERLRLLESVVVNANDAVFITATTPIDELSPPILHVNEAFTRMTGYSPEEVLGKSSGLLHGPKTDGGALAQIRAALQARQPVEVELINYRKDGSEFWVEISITPVADDLGECTHFVAIQRDITERKQIESEREQLLTREQAARAAAEAANRAKDDFLSMVSHELRNPLSAILGYTQLLHTPKLKADTIARALETIERSARLQAQLINDLLDISRITSGKLRLSIYPVDLVLVIEAAIDTVRLVAEAKAIQIESVLDPKAGHILGDANRLQQVILNLLSNAIKFTPQGGHIQVQLERIDDHVQVTVSDTGQGISAEFLPYVFDRFCQADSKNRQAGLGLGLAIVRHLIELHSGTVQVESPGIGQGATVTIKLPLMAIAYPDSATLPKSRDEVTFDNSRHHSIT